MLSLKPYSTGGEEVQAAAKVGKDEGAVALASKKAVTQEFPLRLDSLRVPLDHILRFISDMFDD